jgi:glycosyltransferase involved in cell wall biosynthesis
LTVHEKLNRDHGDQSVRFSLVVATLGRDRELVRLFESLSIQTYNNFEVLVVDQNPDDRLVPIIEKFQKLFGIVHLTSVPGLSRARNVGLKYATGEIIAFPDDDCWYLPNALKEINSALCESPLIDGVTGRYSNEFGKTEGRWQIYSGDVGRENVWRTAISFTIFLRRELVRSIGDFDEQLGVGSGSRWGSGEETDYLLRAIARGATIRYDPEILIRHPVKVTNASTPDSLRRVRAYAAGTGRVIVKNKYGIGYKVIFLTKSFLKIVLYSVLLRTGSVQLAVAELSGRFAGLRG